MLWEYVKSTLFYLLVAVIVFISVFPFYYAILSSIEVGTALFEVNYLPQGLDLSNYQAALRGSFPRNLLNSLVVATSVVALALLLGVTAAYALSRFNFRGRGLLLMTILGVSMFPQIAVLAGLFELVRFTGLHNTLWALIFSYTIFTLPFTVWILTTFMRELPVEIEEAAIVDGATPWIIISKVFMPLMWPALVTTGLLAFIAAWNEFLFALTFTSSNQQRTVPVAIGLLSGSSQYEVPWGPIMAASVTVTLPLIVLVLIFQRKIISGLTAGGVKG
jgi:trehalose/maltose transport system permease protein